jgi:hypothetical protein
MARSSLTQLDITSYSRRLSVVKICGTCKVHKRYKRLHIEVFETGESIYTPPDFVRVGSRQPLIELAQKFTQLQRRDIGLIMEFETRWKIKP